MVIERDDDRSGRGTGGGEGTGSTRTTSQNVDGAAGGNGRSGGSGDAGSSGHSGGSGVAGGSGRIGGSVRAVGSAVNLPAMERLRGRQNYTSWAFAMKMTLIREGSWRAVNPAENQVVDPDLDDRALATICLSLEKNNYSLVQQATTAKQAWESLQKAFQDNGLLRRFGLLDRLTSVKLEECGSVEDYVDELVTTTNSLSEIGFEVNDQWLASLLMKGLPEYYNPMIMGLQASGMELTADVVKAKILQDVKWPLKTSSMEGALYTKQKPRQPRGEKKNGACFTCKKPGHYAANCPQKQGTSKPKGKALWCAMLTAESDKDEAWYFDSAASSHMTRSEENFQKHENQVVSIDTANNQSIKSVAKGLVALELAEGPIEVQEVLHVPDLATNLLSVSKICKKGLTMVFNAEGCEVLDSDGDVIASGTEAHGLYRLNQKKNHKSFLTAEAGIWHKRLGHLNPQNMQKLVSMVDGIDFKKEAVLDCVACIKGKQARGAFGSSSSRADGLLDLVHSDVCGPVEVPSIGGSRYFLTFMDDSSRKVFVYFLESKGKVYEAYEDFKAMAERQSGRKLKILRTDNGTEFVNAAMKRSMKRDGVIHQTSCPYTPEQNGTAERMNRTLVEKARSMLNEAGLPKKFWAEAVSTAAYLVNRCPTRSLEAVTPEEAWSKRKPNLQHLKVFGTKAMYLIPKQKRKKFDAKSEEGIFVGYAENSKGYRIYNSVLKEVFICRDVTMVNEGAVVSHSSMEFVQQPVEFLELCTWIESDEKIDAVANEQIEVRTIEQVGAETNEQIGAEANDQAIPGDQHEDRNVDVVGSHEAESDPALPPQQTRPADEQQGSRRSGRERVIPGKYSDYICFSTVTGPNVSQQPNVTMMVDPDDPATVATMADSDDPTSVTEALKRDDRKHWEKAMMEEIRALEENETWELTELPPGRKAIRTKWVFKTKRDADGQIERHKARLVVKGCSQLPGIDYTEVYAPVVRYSTVRYLMALAVQYNLDIEQMDAVTAFLQGKLKDEDIYMQQPEGFVGDPTKVCKLKRALYGLKQSSRVWNNQLNEALQEFGLTRSKLDSCLYYTIRGGKMTFLTVYVDDLLVFTNDAEMKMKLKSFLNNRFKMKDLGEAKLCLGLRITRDRENGKLFVDQQHYIKDILKRFNMVNSNPVTTPAEPSLKLDKTMCPTTPEEREAMQGVPFKEAVGSLLYAAQATRPDIAYAVNMVSQFSNNPGKRHWEAVKRIFRYLRGTAGARLEYSVEGNPQLTGYTDADWGGDTDTRKSTSGYIFTMMGGAVSWSVKRQVSVALSSCEAEFMALSATIQEGLWWQQLLEQFDRKKAVPVLCDNQSAICIARNNGFNPRTKHISIRYHFVKNVIENGDIELDYISTKEQPADGFTKPLAKLKHQEFRKLIGIVG